MVLSSTYQSTDNPLLSTLYEPLSKHLITVLAKGYESHRSNGIWYRRLGLPIKEDELGA
jgi:hypothetical protein